MDKDKAASSLPSSFRYMNVLEKGRPVHRKDDPFSARHPAMDPGRRAKIFSSFDALKGFRDELSVSEDGVRDDFSDKSDPFEEDP